MAKTSRRILHAEDLDRATQDLLEIADSLRGDLYTRLGQAESSAHIPNIDDRIYDRLRRVLEDEVVPAVKSLDGEIDEAEIDREVVKKALVGLKLDTLRDLAESQGVNSRGSAESLAIRIGQLNKWDQDEIARLILSHRDETSTETGYSSRIFLLENHPDMERVLSELQYANGRYIRTGIARWFAFTSVRADDVGVTLSGVHRTYKASAAEAQDQDAFLAVEPTSTPAELTITNSRAVSVDDVNATVARAIISATELATKLSVQTQAVRDRRSETGLLDSSSEFMLDLVYAGFRNAGFTGGNVRLARFAIPRAAKDEEEEGEEARRAELRAVRFEGRYLFNSLPAAQLMARDKRALVDITLQVSTVVHDKVGTYPVRIAIEGNHVLVATGLGTDLPEHAGMAHARAVDSVRRALDAGIQNSTRLQSHAEEMTALAVSDRETEAVTLIEE